MSDSYQYQDTQYAPYYYPSAGALSTSGEGFQNLQYANGLGWGSKAGQEWQGFQDSGFLQKLQQQQGGQQNYLQQLQGSAPYQQLMQNGSQSFQDYYSPIQGQVDQLYAGPLAQAQKVAQSANPSGMPIGSYENYYAAAANPIQGQMSNMRQQMQQGARAGGNRSGMGMLSSYAPGVAAAGQLGTAGANAANMATRDEQQRGMANANLKQQALNTWTGASGQKAQGLNQQLGQYQGQQNMALASAMSAVMKMLGLQQQNQNQYGFQFGPNGMQFNMSGYAA